MRRAVVFIGGSRDIASTVQLGVAANLAGLAEAGVVVPTSGRRATPRAGLSHQPLTVPTAPVWETLTHELAGAEGDTVLLVVPSWLRSLDTPARHQAVIDRLTRLADEILVVSVVADQLTLINEYYLHQVAVWRVSGRLENLAPRFLNNALFRHEQWLRPWYEAAGVWYVAVPHPDFTNGHPLQVVLRAAGVEIPELPQPGASPASLGPVGVEANRLLATYLRGGVPDFTADARSVVSASRAAMVRAEKQGWCARPFWGWTSETAERAIARFDSSNDRFAQVVWGTEWPLGYPLDRPNRQLDLLDLDPELIEHVHQYVVTIGDRLVEQLKAEQ